MTRNYCWIFKRLSAGEDLCDLAVDHSICPSKEEGGRLGWVRKGQMVPEFEEALFSAPLNKVVRCKTKFGWHLLQVLSERDKASLPGFIVLPLLQFGTWVPEMNSKFDLQKDTYVLCHHGIRSLQVARWLQSQGFRKVYNIS